MESNYIDEIALLKAFIEHKTLTYTEVQEKGIVPVLNKQDRRALFKNTIDKFKQWELIEPIPGSDPQSWKVICEKATAEYLKLQKEIDEKQMIEKYSYEYLKEEVSLNTQKLKGIRIYRILAVTGCALAVFQFITGLSLMQLFTAMKHLLHHLSGH
jgi:hypothetical protein